MWRLCDSSNEPHKHFWATEIKINNFFKLCRAKIKLKIKIKLNYHFNYYLGSFLYFGIHYHVNVIREESKIWHIYMRVNLSGSTHQ